MKYQIDRIATLIGARRVGDSDATIGWLLTDSRSLCFPEETLFFALKTDRNDGHRYITDLYRRGVRSFVVERLPEQLSDYPSANFLKVTNTLAALQRLAERHRDEFSIPVVGITGSNGKTMVKEWLYQLLSPGKTVTRSPRSYNSQIGVPLSVWLIDELTDVALIEAGISQPCEMGALHDIIQPTIGVMTSLGEPHQENFRTLEEKCQEKMQLFAGAKTLIYNSDDDTVSRCVRKAAFGGVKIGWSRVNPAAALYINKVEVGDSSTLVGFLWKGATAGSYRLPFTDEASLECSFACVAASLHLGLSVADLAARMNRLEPIAMRLEVKNGRRGCTLINDSYNNDINSLAIALDFMHRRADRHRQRRTLILSDIYQSGRREEELYRDVAQLARNRGIEKFIGIGREISRQQHVIDIAEKHFFPDVKALVESQLFGAMADEFILIKGSRSFGFDHITELLEEKVHETILEVNLGAVVENLNHYRSHLKPDTKIACMVKADAYGAGAVEVAKTLQDHRVDYLAVAVADEGVTLRNSGITANIMIMNPEMTSFKTLFDYSLEPEVYNFRLLDALIRAAEKEGITGLPVHIKLDTGMHRLGFDPENDIDELIARLKRQSAVVPRSVFSHFVGSDSEIFDEFSARQFELFDTASQRLQAAFPHKIIRHIANSAAITHFPERQLDMVRLGLGLYGVDPCTNSMLSTVSTLKTTILQLRSVAAGETVGYSRRGVLERDSVIAAIPIGYADGLDRHLGNGRGYCIVGGERAPYVGNICMDVALVDVTGIPCHEGDSVEIFGSQLPPTTLAAILDTIPYEVLTAVSNRVKRVYFQD